MSDNFLTNQSQLHQISELALAHATSLGASSAEIGANITDGFTVQVRLGDVETVEYNRDNGVGITVYMGDKKGSASTSDLNPESIKKTVQAACDIAGVTGEDSFSGLADKNLLASTFPDLDLYHPWEITPEHAISLAIECERVGREFDKKISNSEGASVSTHKSLSIYANSNGFSQLRPSSRHSVNCVLIAEENGKMQRDYSYSIARSAQDLEILSSIAKQAARKTIDRLGAKPIKTQNTPVIFHSEIASGLIGHFIGAISGGNLYRKSSFLVNALGKQIFPNNISIYERPFLPKGLGSASYDSEGVATQNKDFIKDGFLESYCLGSYSARKLGLVSTGNAGGIHNLHITSDTKGLDKLIKKMNTGLLVTEVMGQGINLVNGDYSRGASGFWIENGEIQHPVEEITIAGNLKEMFLGIDGVGDDIDLRKNIRTGSILINNMMLAGN